MGERRRAIRSVNGAKILRAPDRFSAQALIELALILPILVVLIVGAFEFGRVFYTKIILTNAAREGAYYLTTHSTSTGSCDATCAAGTFNAVYNEALSSGMELNLNEVTPSIVADPDISGAYIGTVTAQIRMDDLILFGFFHGNVCPYIYPDEEPGDGKFTLCSNVEMMVQ